MSVQPRPICSTFCPVAYGTTLTNSGVRTHTKPLLPPNNTRQAVKTLEYESGVSMESVVDEHPARASIFDTPRRPRTATPKLKSPHSTAPNKASENHPLHFTPVGSDGVPDLPVCNPSAAVLGLFGQYSADSMMFRPLWTMTLGS